VEDYFAVAGGELVVEGVAGWMQEEMQRQEQQQQQIPCGDDNEKGNSNSRSPAGMTTRNATATAGGCAELRMLEEGKSSTIWVWIAIEEVRRYG
jgi:hypothetical protein